MKATKEKVSRPLYGVIVRLADGFAHFEPRELQNLPIGKALCRIERADHDFNLTVPLLDEPDEAEADERRHEVIASSRARIAIPRAEVEAMMLRHFEDAEAKSAAVGRHQLDRHRLSAAGRRQADQQDGRL